MLEVSLRKISEDIQRNIDFFQAPNSRLNQLLNKYKEFADGDASQLKKLDKLLAELGDGGVMPGS